MNTVKKIAAFTALLVFLYIVWKLKVVIIIGSLAFVLAELGYHKQTGTHSKAYRFIQQYSK